MLILGLGLASSAAAFLVGRYTAGSSKRYELIGGILAGLAVGLVITRGQE